MFIIEATRRTKRAYVERIRDIFLEFDSIVWKRLEDIYQKPEDTYIVIRDGKTWVLAIDDPSLEPIEQECGS